MRKTKKRSIDRQTGRILKSLQGKKVGVFVDDANLYHAYKNYGWRVDWGKFRRRIKSFVA